MAVMSFNHAIYFCSFHQGRPSIHCHWPVTTLLLYCMSVVQPAEDCILSTRLFCVNFQPLLPQRGPGSSVGIATNYGMDGSGSNPGGDDFPPVQTGPWAHSVSCKMGTGSFPGGKVRPGRAADHSPLSSAAVMEEQSYTATHPLGHNGPVTGSLYIVTFCSY